MEFLIILILALFVNSRAQRAPITDINLPNVIFDGFTDPEECYAGLEVADLNGDRRISADEYAILVQELGPPGFFDGLDSYIELPLILQSTFSVLACLCKSGGNDGCCEGDNAGLENSGAFAGETPTSSEQSYLFLVCSYTNTAINRVVSSSPPSTSPSEEPTPEPSVSPTTEPVSSAPTAAPTTPAPSTSGPTTSPTTLVPSEAPTTLEPTASPTTAEPSAAPTTAEPTDSPTGFPSLTPVPTAPTAAPSDTPTEGPSDITVTVKYDIAVTGGANERAYLPALIGAMDSLAPEILSFVRRQRRLGRRLQTVQLSTSIDGVQEIECDTRLLKNENDRCEEVTSEIVLLFQPSDADPQGTADSFESDLNDAIEDGELQVALDNTSPTAVVYILTGRTPTVTTTDTGGDGIGGGAVAGVVVSALVGIGLLIGLLLSRRQQEPKEPYDDLDPATGNAGDLAASDDETDEAQGGLVGATKPNYFDKDEDKMVDLDDEDDDKSVDRMSSHGSSASAGSSGWSSSAGVSSLNTGSADGLELDPSSGIGTTLAAMSAQSKPPLDTSVGNAPVVSRSDLDSAIESGDWAAVGATAALLAAASDSQSYSSHSQSRSVLEGSGGRSQTASTASSLDAARAAELDHLVDAGDWEGVVLAAARYEASESESASRSASYSMANTQDSSLGSSPSKVQKRKEMRAIVEELVRRVVPEEIENVDEMMLQFRGREEELIETLRTMEERAVAQKARQGAQKAAKLEAKQAVTAARASEASSLRRPSSKSEEGVTSKSLGTGQMSSKPASAKSLGSGQIETSAKSTSLGTGVMSTASDEDRKSAKQSALERAIEAGDWEAVGEAAAMLSDNASTGSSAMTDDVNRFTDGISSQGSSVDVASSIGAEELEDLIDRGDWTGVVQAASKYDKAKERVPTKEEEEAARRERRLKHLQAEQEALQQADIWMAIAEQSAAESTSPQQQGAKEAVDWAISRSLSALVSAEQRGSLRDRSRSRSPPSGNVEPLEGIEEEV